MGNQSSSSSSKLRHFRESWRKHKNGTNGQKNGGPHVSDADKIRPPPQISHKYFDMDEVEQLRECWSHMEGHLHDILSDSFLELFAEKPDIKDKFFEFRNYTIEDLRKHQPEAEANGLNALQRHVPRVSRAITKVVKLMDRPANAAEYLQVLGKIHHQMGITVQELSLFGPFFVSNSVRHLPSHLRERKFQELWIRFFAILIELLERGYPEQEIELDHREKALIRQENT